MKAISIVVVFVVLLLVAGIIRSRRSYRERVAPVAARYAEVQLGMSANDLDRIFSGYRIGEVRRLSDPKAHKIDADSMQLVFVKLRFWGEDALAFYYKDGLVVGKQIQGYDPYPEDEFPTVKPNHAVEPTRALSGESGSP